MRTDMADRYHLLKENSVCVSCGTADAKKGRVLCELCSLNARDRDKLCRDNLRERGVCLDCRVNTTERSRTSDRFKSVCPACIIKRKKAHGRPIIGPMPLKPIEKLSKSGAKARDRKSRGVCVTCGNREPMPCRVRCEQCAENSRQRQRRLWHEKRHERARIKRLG